MEIHRVPWEVILPAAIKLLKFLGIIPGAAAAYGLKRLYQKRRQKRASDGWPTVEATILRGEVHQEGWRNFWAELTYYYFVGEYRTGRYVRHFRREEDANEFIRQAREQRVQVRYDDSNPEHSVILDRDIEMLVCLSPLMG
jgi:hypothetical protein